MLNARPSAKVGKLSATSASRAQPGLDLLDRLAGLDPHAEFAGERLERFALRKQAGQRHDDLAVRRDRLVFRRARQSSATSGPPQAAA